MEVSISYKISNQSLILFGENEIRKENTHNEYSDEF